MKYLLLLTAFLAIHVLQAQKGSAGNRTDSTGLDEPVRIKPRSKVMFGTASYYADKFQGRKTANGEIFDNKKMTAACNTLPLGTWIRVTNLSNNRSVVVKTNDRLHPRMTRILDLSRAAAEKLGYIRKGLTKVKVEVLERRGKE